MGSMSRSVKNLRCVLMLWIFQSFFFMGGGGGGGWIKIYHFYWGYPMKTCDEVFEFWVIFCWRFNFHVPLNVMNHPWLRNGFQWIPWRWRRSKWITRTTMVWKSAVQHAAGCRTPISRLSLPCQWTGWDPWVVFWPGVNDSHPERSVLQVIFLTIWMLFNWVSRLEMIKIYKHHSLKKEILVVFFQGYT